MRGLPRVTWNAALLQLLRRLLPHATPDLLSPFILFTCRTSNGSRSCTMADLPTIRIGYVPGTSAPPTASASDGNITAVLPCGIYLLRSFLLSTRHNIADNKFLPRTRTLPYPSSSRTPFPGRCFPPIQNHHNSLPIRDRTHDHIASRK